jgi:hypothetical protein
VKEGYRMAVKKIDKIRRRKKEIVPKLQSADYRLQI